MTKGKITFFATIGVILLLVISLTDFLREPTTGSCPWMSRKKFLAQVENQLQRRYDLIPNLVETSKVMRNRRRTYLLKSPMPGPSGGAANVPDKITANNELSGALSRLMWLWKGILT